MDTPFSLGRVIISKDLLARHMDEGEIMFKRVGRIMD